MFPTIDKRKTGVHLRKLMDERRLTVKDVRKYLGLGSVQSVYHWINGISMPTIDNLYALSALFQVPVDDMLCGNRRPMPITAKHTQYSRLWAYYERISGMGAA